MSKEENNDKVFSDTPLSDGAQKEFNEFLSRLREGIKKVTEVPLVVLIWGPSETSSNKEEFAKRNQIKQELRSKKHAAVFSEELEKPKDINQRTFEHIQAKESDCIIIMATGHGPTGELHDFASDVIIASKMFVFVPERARDSYTDKGLLKDLKERGIAKIKEYSREDLKKCSLIDEVLKFVKAWQQNKSMQKRERDDVA